MNTGTVFDIQRFSVHDGPGIRTTVFLKGCPLRCVWCQNPEGIDPAIRLRNFENLCTGCGRCVASCPHGALTPGETGRPHINHSVCRSSGVCVEECLRNAMALDGRVVTADELVAQLLDDVVFFRSSSGGVTFSGGEPLMQAEFVHDVASRLRDNGVPTAIESCLEAPWASVETVLPVIDVFQIDIKLADAERHQDATGVDNRRILDNFRALAERLDGTGRLIVRIPLIPGFTADTENLAAIGGIIRDAGRGIAVELLNFNPLAAAKYRRLPESRYTLTDAQSFPREEIALFENIVRNP